MNTPDTMNVDTLVERIMRLRGNSDVRQFAAEVADLAARAREARAFEEAEADANERAEAAVAARDELEAVLREWVWQEESEGRKVPASVDDALAGDGGGSPADSVEARVILSERDETFDVKNIPAGDGGGA